MRPDGTANQGQPSPPLTQFDATSLVVGAVIGADIYVVASLGAGLLGPANLVAWVISGIIAGLIALSFAQCAAIVTRTGGSYAYAENAYGHLAGFLAGWTLYLAELVSIAVFPVAFARYLLFFVPGLAAWQVLLAKAAFVAFLTLTNYVGTRTTGRVNDVLAVGKLGPLLLLIILGLIFVGVQSGTAAANLTPFVPLGWSGLGPALILTFWAYAGFELAVLPADEIANPGRTLPLAMAVGMAISTAFYLLVNATVTVAVPWPALAKSTAPLALALEAILRALSSPFFFIGGAVMALGALLSISGADESAMLGTSRLSYAMAADGYFPRIFARLHPKHRTPYVAVIFQGIVALVASAFGSLTGLIRLSVFFLAFTYLATVLAEIRLIQRAPERQFRFPGAGIMPLLALGGVLYLFSQTEALALSVGAALTAAGVPIYYGFAPKNQLDQARRILLSSEHEIAAIERALLVAPTRAIQVVGTALAALSSRRH